MLNAQEGGRKGKNLDVIIQLNDICFLSNRCTDLQPVGLTENPFCFGFFSLYRTDMENTKKRKDLHNMKIITRSALISSLGRRTGIILKVSQKTTSKLGTCDTSCHYKHPALKGSCKQD